MLVRLVVRFQYVLAKIISFFAPDGVNMVRLITKAAVVELDQERRAVNDKVVSLTFLIASNPAEIHLVPTGFGNLIIFQIGLFAVQIVNVLVHDKL